MHNKRTAFLGRRHHAVQVVLAAICIVLFSVVLLAFIAPLLSAISPLAHGATSGAAKEINSSLHPRFSSYLSDFFNSTLFKITLFTFEESLASTVIALLVGLPTAFFVAKKKFFGRKLLLASSSVPLCIPSLIVALGYVSTFGMSGYVNDLLMHVLHTNEPPLTFLYSFWGIVITQGFYNFPLIMATVADSWSMLPSEQAEGARLLGASELRIFRTITLYQLLPSIISACIPVFLYSFFSFMIVLLFGATGCTTLEVAVYHSARSTLDFSSASQYALVETVSAFIMVFLYGVIENKAARSRGVTFSSEKQARSVPSRKELLPLVILLFVIAVFFFVPLISIAISSFAPHRATGGTFGDISTNSLSASEALLTSFIEHLSSWRKLFSLKGFLPAVRTTLLTALATGLLCTVTAFVYAVFLRTSKSFSSNEATSARIKLQNTLLRTLPLLPMAVSSVVIGVGMTLLVKRGTTATLILAQAALYWPFAFRQIYTPLSKMPDSILDASRLLSPYKLDGVFRVCVPYSFRSLVSAFGFCFAMSAGDATLPLVLAIPRFDTLSLFTYRLAGSHHFSEACASGLLLGLLCAVVFAFATKMKEK